MRPAAVLLLLAGSARGQGSSTTLGPLSTSGSSINTALSSLTFSTNGIAYDFSLTDESVSSSGVYTYQVGVTPAPTAATCQDVLGKLVEEIKKGQTSGTTVEASTACGSTGAVVVPSRRAALLQAGVVTITVTPPVPSAAPTTSSPTTAAPTTGAPTTAAPTTSCPDKYGAAVCAPFLAEGLCKEELAMAWCPGSCGTCSSAKGCKALGKKECKASGDCKWKKKKDKCKAKKDKKGKKCKKLNKKKCKKSDACKWSKKKDKCKAQKGKKCKKLSKKKCKKSDSCKWKSKKNKCKAKKDKASTERRPATLESRSEESDSSSDEEETSEGVDDSEGTDDSETED